MRTSITLIGCAGALLLASACGAAAVSSSSAGSTGSSTTATDATSVSISYPIALKVGSPDGLMARCPAGTTCKVERDSLGPVIRKSRWVLIVHRALACGSAARGDYANPAAVCHAFELYAHARMATPSVCACPMVAVPQAEAVGSVNGRHVILTMGVCGACGLGKRPLAHVGMLTPGALSGSAIV
ncbi:MAG TPA: hypothetical protein VKV34_03775 [Thermoleophilia bacterium]|nr:hypothetical protein [Thermoleophilia bacterium]